MAGSDNTGSAAGGDAGGFVVTQTGDRLIAQWRPSRAVRVFHWIMPVLAWLMLPVLLMAQTKGSVSMHGIWQVDLFYLMMLVGLGVIMGVPMTCIAVPLLRQRLRVEMSDDELTITLRGLRTIRAVWTRSELVHVETLGDKTKRLLVVGRRRPMFLMTMPTRAIEWLQETIRRRYGLGERPEPAWLEPGRGVIPPAEYARQVSTTVGLPSAAGLVYDLPRISTSAMRRATLQGLRNTAVRLGVTVALLTGWFWVQSLVPQPNTAPMVGIQVFITCLICFGFGVIGLPAFLVCLGIFARQESIIVAEDALISTVRHGLFRMRRVRRLESLRQLTVRSISTGEDTTLGEQGETLARLDAEFEGKPRLCLAEGHSRAKLVELAKAIAYEARRRQAAVTLIDHPHRAATVADLLGWQSDISLTVLETGPITRVQAATADQSLPRMAGALSLVLSFALAAMGGGAVWLWHHRTVEDTLLVVGCVAAAVLVGRLSAWTERYFTHTRTGTIALSADELVWTPGRRGAMPRRWKLDQVTGFATRERLDSQGSEVAWAVELIRRSGSSESLMVSPVAEQAREVVATLNAAMGQLIGKTSPDRHNTPKLDWLAFATTVAPAPPKPRMIKSESVEGGTRLHAFATRDALPLLFAVVSLLVALVVGMATKRLVLSSDPSAVKYLAGVPMGAIAVCALLYGLTGFAFVRLTMQHPCLVLNDEMLACPSADGKQIGVAWNDLESVEVRRGSTKGLCVGATRIGLVIITYRLPTELWARLGDGTEVRLVMDDEPARLAWLKATIEAAAAWRRDRVS